MVRDREKQVNPATAHLKSQKAAALKKSKAQVQAQRTERLATRNPERLQRRADELKQQRDAQGGVLGGKEKQELERLEREVVAIRKARADGHGEGGSVGREGGGKGRGGFERGEGRGGRGRGGDGRGGSALGKRRRDDGFDGDEQNAESDTDPEVRDIPMPRDTPPPIPPRRNRNNPNSEPIANPRMPHALPAKPPSAAPVQAQITYSSAPQIRDLRKEATAKFVPAAVASKLRKVPGAAGGKAADGVLLEPEEVDRLEEAGYMGHKPVGGASESRGKEAEEEEEEEEEAEEARFERELREMEEQMRQTERETQANTVTAARHDLRDAGRRDAERAVDAAEEEAEYNMMANEEEDDKDDLMNLQIPTKNQYSAAQSAEKELRRVEVEEPAGPNLAAQAAKKKLRLVDIEDVDDDEW